MTKTLKDAEFEKLKLPVPNPYGKTVKIERVNMLIERAYRQAQTTLFQQLLTDIEGMKVHPKEAEPKYSPYHDGYNQALDDVIKLLQESEGE